MKDLITLDNHPDILKEVEDAFYDIPFENSQFQTENFVINDQFTPERAYRAIGLRIFNRIRALREAQYGRMIEDVDIEELREKLEDPDVNKFDKKRAQIEIDHKLANRPHTDKLINDAVKELNVLYKHFKRLPRYTREEFEAGEEAYFTESLTRQVKGIVGAHESLLNMQQASPALTFNSDKKELGHGRRQSISTFDDGRRRKSCS